MSETKIPEPRTDGIVACDPVPFRPTSEAGGVEVTSALPVVVAYLSVAIVVAIASGAHLWREHSDEHLSNALAATLVGLFCPLIFIAMLAGRVLAALGI